MKIYFASYISKNEGRADQLSEYIQSVTHIDANNMANISQKQTILIPNSISLSENHRKASTKYNQHATLKMKYGRKR